LRRCSIGIARAKSEVARARAELLRRDYIVAVWCCDVWDQSAVESTLQEIGRKFGAIDILINNAGEIVVGPLESMTTADFDQALKIHFWAPLNVTLAALLHFRKNTETRIANISSIGGLMAVPHLGI
jgi:NAD(P)-dependent dehydrogenase (short-subunit alcohol dehydrogenase family)